MSGTASRRPGSEAEIGIRLLPQSLHGSQRGTGHDPSNDRGERHGGRNPDQQQGTKARDGIPLVLERSADHQDLAVAGARDQEPAFHRLLARIDGPIEEVG